MLPELVEAGHEKAGRFAADGPLRVCLRSSCGGEVVWSGSGGGCPRASGGTGMSPRDPFGCPRGVGLVRRGAPVPALSAADVAAEHGWHDVAWHLARSLTTYHHRRDHADADLRTWGLALQESEKPGPALVTVHRRLGEAHADARSAPTRRSSRPRPWVTCCDAGARSSPSAIQASARPVSHHTISGDCSRRSL